MNRVDIIVAQSLLNPITEACYKTFHQAVDMEHLVRMIQGLTQEERNHIHEYLHTISFAAKEAEKRAFVARAKE